MPEQQQQGTLPEEEQQQGTHAEQQQQGTSICHSDDRKNLQQQ
jgi:hypothetical protein